MKRIFSIMAVLVIAFVAPLGVIAQNGCPSRQACNYDPLADNIPENYESCIYSEENGYDPSGVYKLTSMPGSSWYNLQLETGSDIILLEFFSDGDVSFHFVSGVESFTASAGDWESCSGGKVRIDVFNLYFPLSVQFDSHGYAVGFGVCQDYVINPNSQFSLSPFGGNCPADINNDCVTNSNDLLTLLAYFGEECEGCGGETDPIEPTCSNSVIDELEVVMDLNVEDMVVRVENNTPTNGVTVAHGELDQGLACLYLQEISFQVDAKDCEGNFVDPGNVISQAYIYWEDEDILMSSDLESGYFYFGFLEGVNGELGGDIDFHIDFDFYPTANGENYGEGVSVEVSLHGLTAYDGTGSFVLPDQVDTDGGVEFFIFHEGYYLDDFNADADIFNNGTVGGFEFEFELCAMDDHVFLSDSVVFSPVGDMTYFRFRKNGSPYIPDPSEVSYTIETTADIANDFPAYYIDDEDCEDFVINIFLVPSEPGVYKCELMSLPYVNDPDDDLDWKSLDSNYLQDYLGLKTEDIFLFGSD